MKIRVWGARGSIPVSGEEFLKYGGDTTCFEIRSKRNKLIIIDAGTGIRRLGNQLLREDIKEITMLFTHSHWDHLMGLPFFKPLYMSKYSINMYGCPFADHSIHNVISRTMEPPFFPIEFTKLNSKIKFENFRIRKWKIDTIEITPIYISHPNKGVGYKFVENGKSFVLLTDNELGYLHDGGLDFSSYVGFAKGVDVLFHDSEYTPEDYKQTWGHSTYREALNLAMEADVKQLGLIHHNQDRNDAEIDTMVTHCNSIIRDNGSELTCFGAYPGLEIEI